MVEYHSRFGAYGFGYQRPQTLVGTREEYVLVEQYTFNIAMGFV